jgi:hypothetical protein
MGRRIFEQDQIRRAAELGLGASGPGQVEVVGADAASRDYAAKIAGILAQG